MTDVDFVRAFRRAHRRLADRLGQNLVPLAELRAALPTVDGPTFDREVRALQLAGSVVLHTHDGRHNPPELAQWRAAGIVADGREYVYAAIVAGGGW